MGATALTLTDLLLAGATRAAGVSASGAAALVVLANSAGLSVTELGRRVGLSQPAAARMVDGLEAAGLVERRAGVGRSLTVALAPSGREAARRLLGARAAPLTDVIGVLDDTEQAALADLLDKMLTRLYPEVGSTELLCRLCDRSACTTGAVCPVGAAHRAASR